MGERTTTPSGLSASEELLARTFEHWREEFRSILENHRREIQDRLEKIEREIEKKSDKENVEVLVRSIYSDLHRHAEMGTETMWKIVGLVLTIGSTIGGLVGFLIHLLLKVNP